MKNSRYRMLAIAFCCPATVAAQQSSGVLNADNHPNSPNYLTVFDREIAPLDERISWIKRFKGDARFNAIEDIREGNTNEMADSSNDESLRDTASDYDATGVVERIDIAGQKLKVSHGPIASMDMPAMTMMFKVVDAQKFARTRVGDEIRFNLKDSDEGFLITELQSVDAEPEASQASKMDATGIIRAVRGDKFKIEHGPIEKFDMPGMTMMFRVTDPETVAQGKVGDEIGFNVTDSSEGFLITEVQKVGDNPDTSQSQAMDASGEIKAVRGDKLKIKHGPIQKFDMPGMTMLFTTSDPSMLDGLAVGTTVEFDVVDTDAGFVITRIKPVK